MNTPLEHLAGPANRGPAHWQAIPSHRLLVVEDDPTMRNLGAQVLVRAGYQVDAAEDGAAGWEALRAERYDLLITDHRMPRLSGLELVKKLRSARMTLPVV